MTEMDVWEQELISDEAWQNYGKLIGKLWRVFPDAEFRTKLESLGDLKVPGRTALHIKVVRSGVAQDVREVILTRVFEEVGEDESFWNNVFDRLVRSLSNKVAKGAPAQDV